ncbi:MAG TPA: dihydroorotate dehydrogenase-like protein [Anaerolineales bacterium]|nr:dihydroorotate dehydrogenase-like protein [Anaerolineales bacterium]
MDLSTTYLGMELKNPLIAAASPLSKNVQRVKRLEAAGIAAVVLHSLFEEQIIHESLELDHYLSRSKDFSAEASSYLPDTGEYSLLPDKYLEHVAKVKKEVGIPVIGSLNGVSTGGWVRYARLIQEAGADALELNLYYLPIDPALTAEEIEAAQVELVATVKSSISVPLAVKLSPFYTALPNFVRRLAGVGADGIVLFNRFYQPDFDLEQLSIAHTLDLSTPSEMRMPLRWISILYGTIHSDLALTSGVHDHTGVLKAMMAGARVVMLASELLHRGPDRIPEILAELSSWMIDKEYDSLRQMQGSMSQKSVAEPAAFERANYMKVLGSFRDLP